ncbi:hypothetical protein FRB99_005052 [Tulasnella sp. 403]|nr:hypothetical protein FRB99_005052 [Tulasnella sp. 403]
MSPQQAHSASDVDESVGTPEDHSGQGASSKPGRKKNPKYADSCYFVTFGLELTKGVYLKHAGREKGPEPNRTEGVQAAKAAEGKPPLFKSPHIRDLEARVELLSGNKEETYSQMRDIMRTLMSENQQLRNLLKELGRFIGDGAGGQLQASLSTIGWQFDDFQNYLNRAETDTAFETFMALKRTRAGSTPVGDNADEGDPEKKRRRVDTSSSGTNGIYGLGGGASQSPIAHSPTAATAFATLIDNHVFVPPPPTANFPSSSSGMAGLTQPRTASSRNNSLNTEAPPSSAFTPSFNSYIGPSPRSANNPSTNLPPISNLPVSSSTARGDGSSTNDALFNDEIVSLEDETLMRKNEAEQVIDSVPFPELRDRLILLKDRYELPAVLHSMFLNCTIHGDDVLQHTNWEIHKPWMERYPFLVEESVVNIANKWRRERGDPEIILSELVKD